MRRTPRLLRSSTSLWERGARDERSLRWPHPYCGMTSNSRWMESRPARKNLYNTREKSRPCGEKELRRPKKRDGKCRTRCEKHFPASLKSPPRREQKTLGQVRGKSSFFPPFLPDVTLKGWYCAAIKHEQLKPVFYLKLTAAPAQATLERLHT